MAWRQPRFANHATEAFTAAHSAGSVFGKLHGGFLSGRSVARLCRPSTVRRLGFVCDDDKTKAPERFVDAFAHKTMFLKEAG